MKEAQCGEHLLAHKANGTEASPQELAAFQPVVKVHPKQLKHNHSVAPAQVNTREAFYKRLFNVNREERHTGSVTEKLCTTDFT